MNSILAVIGLNGGELILMLVALLVFFAFVIGAIVLVIVLTKRITKQQSPPPLPHQPGQQSCPHCGADLAASAARPPTLKN